MSLESAEQLARQRVFDAARQSRLPGELSSVRVEDQGKSPARLYRGLIGIGNSSGAVVQIEAVSSADARAKLVELYGEGQVIMLDNDEESANRPRSACR